MTDNVYNNRQEVVTALGHLKIMSVPGIEEILDKYFIESHRVAETNDKMSIKGFHNKFVKSINPTITYGQWLELSKRLRGVRKRGRQTPKTDIIPNEFVSVETEHQATAPANIGGFNEDPEIHALNKLLEVLHLTLDDLQANPNLMKKIPIEQRVNLLFKGMSARDSRIKTSLAKREDDRKESSFKQTLMKSRYSRTKPNLNG